MDGARDEFYRHLQAWRDYIEASGVGALSNTQPYVENEPYQQIIALGDAALPFLIEELRAGNHFMNTAVIVIAGLRRDEVITRPPEGPFPFHSSQEISQFLVEWWERRQRTGNV